MVGVAGLEPAASWSRTKRDTKLRHTPKAEGKEKERAAARPFRLEAPPRFELGHQDFADPCLTTWLWRRTIYYIQKEVL